MKKILTIAISFFVITSCTKNVNEPDMEKASNQSMFVDAVDPDVPFETGGIRPVEGNAIIEFDNDFGWILAFEDKKFEVPEALPEQYKNEGMKVHVAFLHTSKEVPCNCSVVKYYVTIKDIERLAQTAAE